MEHEQHSQIMSTLAVICEKQDATEKHLAELNGKAVIAINGVNDLQKDKVSFLASFKTAKWMFGGTVTIFLLLIGGITSMGVYAYQGDKKSLEIKTQEVASKADTVATDLSAYQSQQSSQEQKIIDLLTKLTKK